MELKNKKSLVIYFSHTGENYVAGGLKNIDKGNTEVIAEMIQSVTGADMFKVETEKEYPYGYYDCCSEAKSELSEKARPKLKKYLDNIDSYEVIYVGSPVWYGHIAMAMYSALENLDFQGKTVKLFVTHEGSGFGNCSSDIEKLCDGANIAEGIAIFGSKVNESSEKIKSWIE